MSSSALITDRTEPNFSQTSPSANFKIALLTYSTKPRGSVIHTLELAEALHHLSNEVCVYALDKDGTGFDYPLTCNYQLVPAQSALADMDALIQQRIQEFVDYLSHSEQTYDCYHAQDCISANALAKLVQQQQIPHFVRTVHHIEDYSSPYLQQCQDRSIRGANLCFCVSDYWQTVVQQQYQIQAPRIINGVNLDRFTPVLNDTEQDLKERWGLNGSPIYLTVGGIEPRKNSIRLLQAFAQVQSHYPNAQLAIAGGATLFDYQSYRDKFFAIADTLEIKIGHSLVLPGVIADVDLPALYRTADAFVFPSVKEGWGLVLLEAIASGLPVLTSHQTPFTEFLAPTQALLVDPESPTAIAQAMQAMVQSDLSRSLVQHSQSVLSRYTWAASAEMHLHHYKQLLASYA
ncbi:MSMEG_0565 family glycosyltransferase [Trichocoleus sp. FACHB-591]|uniref:MSMEG_0565 family glycosyltransferase n=1 Tax=Trichocoleus sp. FACHB-591 TaxID=2692872 RepID=UPI0016893A4C|nr:MSMEG_0565 family glycosyltransferase [Trichocoleus sp. FACHB-591]MBD2096449.1 MSMEG_0565 family glycosyltransferase [Trichocoleus sp. FACHB-591]